MFLRPAFGFRKCGIKAQRMGKAILAGVAIGVGVTSAFGADDWGMRNEYSFRIPVFKDRLDLNASMHTRWRDDMDEFYRYGFYAGPDFHLGRHLAAGVRYGNIQEGEPGEFRTEHRLRQLLTPKFKLEDLGGGDSLLGAMSFALQNRLDLRIRRHADHENTWKYRFYPKVSYPVYKAEKIAISPYAGNAFYFDLTDGIAYNENKTYGGLSFRLFKQFTVDCYYMRSVERNGAGGPWTGRHWVGTAVNFEL